MEDGSFGARLRRDREQRGVSLEDLSAATRISVRMLDAFETERWDRLPGGFFNRGFLRSIARHLKMDEAALLGAYAAVTGDSHENRSAEVPPGHSHILWISAAVLLLAAALAAGAWLVYGGSRPQTARRPIARPAPSSTTTAKPRR